MVEKYLALYLHMPKRFYGVMLRATDRDNIYLHVHIKCMENVYYQVFLR